MCTHKNRLSEAILMRTHKIPSCYRKSKRSLLCLLTWRYYQPSLARTTRLKIIFRVLKVFEPLKFDYVLNSSRGQSINSLSVDLFWCNLLPYVHILWYNKSIAPLPTCILLLTQTSSSYPRLSNFYVLFLLCF